MPEGGYVDPNLTVDQFDLSTVDSVFSAAAPLGEDVAKVYPPGHTHIAELTVGGVTYNVTDDGIRPAHDSPSDS